MGNYKCMTILKIVEGAHNELTLSQRFISGVH